MKKSLNNTGVFSNCIPDQDGSVSILLYGDIGDNKAVNSNEIVSKLMELSKEYKAINIHINSNGGDVFSGIAIFNALRSTKAKITIYVDGIAASIAGVIALCGKPLYMSQFSKLMLHSVSCGIFGNKSGFQEAISVIEDLEGTLAGMLSTRCRKDKDEIKSAYFDGKDHWITAQEAYSMGLIDGICDLDEAIPGNDNTTENIYNYFNNKLTVSKQNMELLNKIKGLSSFSGLETEEQIYGRIVELSSGERPRDARGFLNKACEEGIVSDQEAKDILHLTDGDAVRIRQYIDKKDKEACAKFEAEYEDLIKYKSEYMALRNLPDSFLGKELKQLASKNFRSFKEMVLKSRKNRAVNYIDEPLNKPSEKVDWGLEDYRKHAPHELSRNPILYKELLEREYEK